MRSSRVTSLLGVVLVFGLFSGSARADVSEAVQKKLKGELLVSDQPFSKDGESDAAVVKSLHKQVKVAVAHQDVEGVPSWHFAFVAFMSKKPEASELSLDFFLDDKSHAYVANKHLTGIDAQLTLLESEVDISEDDGLAAGRSYVVRLTAQVKGKNVVLASGKIKTK